MNVSTCLTISSGRSRPDDGTGVIKKACGHISPLQSAFCLLNITGGHIAAKVTAMRQKWELKQHIMAPLISYFRDARAELGITAKQIAEATGKKNMVSHWFGASQWQLPNEADYRKLQALFSRIAAESWSKVSGTTTGTTTPPAYGGIL